MSLVLGKNHLTREELANCKTPEATDRFVPIPHKELADLVADSLIAAGFTIEDEDHVTARDDLRYFGGFAISKKDMAGEDRRIVCGLRNSCDKSFAAAICIGTQMMVCENLCFSSEKQLARRHTKNIRRDLPAVVSSVIASLITEWSEMTERIDLYQNQVISEAEACELAVRLVDCKSLPKQKLYGVIEHFRNPSIAAESMIDRSLFEVKVSPDGVAVDEFDEVGFKEAVAAKASELNAAFGEGETLWGLYNAVTQELKGSDIHKLPSRTMGLQGLFDSEVGFEKVVGEAIQEPSESDEENFKEVFENEDSNSTIDFEIEVD